MREYLLTHKEISGKLDELERRVTGHDKHIRALFDAIRQLMTPPEKRQTPHRLPPPQWEMTASIHPAFRPSICHTGLDPVFIKAVIVSGAQPANPCLPKMTHLHNMPPINFLEGRRRKTLLPIPSTEVKPFDLNELRNRVAE